MTRVVLVAVCLAACAQLAFCARGSWCKPVDQCESILRLYTPELGKRPDVVSTLLTWKSWCEDDEEDPDTTDAPPTKPYICCIQDDAKEINPPPAPKALPMQPGDLSELPGPGACGVSAGSDNRVIGGRNSTLGKFPWMALLGFKVKERTTFDCGGSLVTSRHVLTAAHCTQGREEELYMVRLGELDYARADEGATPVDVPVRSVLSHERYDRAYHENDIALLLLDGDVTFTDLISPICVPISAEHRKMTFEGHHPIVAGWGALERCGPSATRLQHLQVKVTEQTVCKETFKAATLKFDDRILCAGLANQMRDSCRGDSGGPLMKGMYDDDASKYFYYVIGVVSTGHDCATGLPALYTRVTHFADWIHEKITGRGLK